MQSGGIKKPGFSAAVPAKRIIANGNNKNGKKPTVVKSATTTKVGTKAKPVAKNKPVKGGKLATALETAIAISNNKKHRNCSEVCLCLIPFCSVFVTLFAFM